jgi:hypothetical protein
MLNYISRYTPPVQAQAPKVINSQRSGASTEIKENPELVNLIMPAMSSCLGYARELREASVEETPRITALLLSSVEAFRTMSGELVGYLEGIIKSETGIRVSDLIENNETPL